MVEKYCKKLNLSTLKQLQSYLDYPEVYQADANIFFKGHVPHVALVTAQGELIMETTKETYSIKENSLIAFKELYHNEPLKYGLKANAGAKIFVISKPMIHMILEDLELKDIV